MKQKVIIISPTRRPQWCRSVNFWTVDLSLSDCDSMNYISNLVGEVDLDYVEFVHLYNAGFDNLKITE